MTRLETLSLHETELLSGGCCEAPTTNPSQAYYYGINYGQAKQIEGFSAPNPSEIYCGLNYGQSKKPA